MATELRFSAVPVEARLVVRTVRTGAEPVLVVAADGRRYWVKAPTNPHGTLSLVHELVIAGLAEQMGAPFALGRLVHVPAGLAAPLRFQDGRRCPPGLWFGSRVVPGTETTSICHAASDGNPQRVPWYLALWHLCLGVDPQLMTDAQSNHQLTSIDHGLWFDSLEGDWVTRADRLTREISTAWSDPDWLPPFTTDRAAWLAAAAALEALQPDILLALTRSTPLQWGIPTGDLDDLAAFLAARKGVVAAQMRSRAAEVRGWR